MADTFNMSDVMISYSRRDKEFVRRLEQALRQTGREVWVDWEDIPTGADFIQEIFAGIEAANTFVFIISPDSVASAVCLEEVKHAVLHRKRFVPILYREITEEAKKAFHPALGSHNWLFFRETDDFDDAFKLLIKSLETDLNHVRFHTRLLVRARDWEDKGRGDSLALRGDDLREAEAWLKQNAHKSPEPTDLQREFIQTSRRLATRRTRVTAGIAAAVILIGMLALVAVNQSVAAQQAFAAEALARQTSIANERAALAAAVTATIAQGQAVKQAANAASAAEAAINARATSDANAEIARRSAATATIAQGQALIQADNAATAAAEAEIARATSDYNAVIALQNAATATVAQGLALIEADNAATQAAAADIARATSDANAEIALQNAATATIAQGQALIQADNAATAAAEARLAATAEAQARATSIVNEQLALQNAGTAVAAQGTALFEAARAATQERLAVDNAATAVAAQATVAAAAQREAQLQATIAGQQAATATVAVGQAAQQEARARALALSNSAAQVFNTGNTDLALALALQANAADMTSAQAFRTLAQFAYAPGTRLLFGLEAGEQHTAAVTQLVYSPDGRYVLTGSRDSSVRLWDAATGKLVRVFGQTGDRHTSPVNTVALSPDGQLAVSGDDGGDMILWDVETGTARRRFGNASGYTLLEPIISATFRPDNPDRVYATNGRNLTVWNARTGELISRQTLTAVTQVGANLSLSSNGLLVLLGNSLWSANNLTERQRTFADGWIGAFGPRAETIFTVPAPDSNVVIQREIVSQIERRRYEGHAGRITSLVVSPSGRYVLAGAGGGNQPSPDYSLILWDAAAGTLLRRYSGHTSPVLTIAFSPDESFITSGSEDGQVRLWELAPENATFTADLTHPVRAMAYSPDGTRLALGYDDQSIGLWDVEAERELDRLAGQGNDFTELAFTPDGATLVSADISGTIIVWDVARGVERRRFSAGSTAAHIALSPDASTVLAGTGEGTLRFWDLNTGQVTRRLTSDAGPVSAVAISPDGGLILSAHAVPLRNQLVFWDAASGQEIRRVLTNEIGRIAFNPAGDGRALVNAGSTIELWDTGAAVGQPLGGDGETHPGPVVDLAFGPDGSTAVSASLTDIRLWDVASGRLIYTYQPGASAVAYRPDGLQLAGASGNPFVFSSPANALNLFRAGSRGQLIEWVTANRYVRELSCDERRQYRVVPLCDAATLALTPTATPEMVIIQADVNRVNLRERPSENARAITSVERGAQLLVLGRAVGWVNVRLPDGREGWVRDELTRPR